MTEVAGVILAGGQATRMGGGDKGLREIAGRTMLDHVIDRFAPQVDALALNANGDGARFSAYGLPVLPDSVAGYPGPLAGVLAGLDWAAAEGHAQVATVAVDTPFFPTDLVARLSAAAGGGLALAATEEDGKLWRHPTFGLWPVSLRDDLRAALAQGLRKIVMWTDRHDAATVIFDSRSRDPFFNVNTPEDLALAQAMVRG
jgi:molybdopterin-guanine dinucleotide biosynthesis protein A